ncbi:chitin binding peritrophin-A domain-containing protein [Flavobacterium sp. HJJ]|uniref:chitin binding peritrophin-A domain-containing protein n=1 Tax=Flavobacterium sp. HJJ TaxID=2783792 RepID=UPI00188B93CA|nr:chitin binding peritrophin-A domain-containing protein [Flavobacterium sp. HJJ]MBF4472561.1 chitin binding domain-containing protein [Flavobacterium sp. HJJ]
MKKTVFSLLLFIGVTASSVAQYTPHSWTLRIHTSLIPGGYYSADACNGYESDGGILPNQSDPFSFYICNNIDYTTNVMGCPLSLIFNPKELACDYPMNVDKSYFPNFPWEDYNM